MAINIETFSNQRGGNSFFKAVGHPKVADAARALVARLAAARSVAVYDIHGYAAGFAELFPLGGVPIAAAFVQDLEEIGRPVLGHAAQPVTDLAGCGCDLVFVATFDAERPIAHIRHLVPDGAAIVSLDAIRLPPAMLTNPRRYLDPLNFATNFALLRDGGGHHTRLVTANYWAGYGATAVRLWCRLMDETGTALAEWEDALPDSVATVSIDSRAVRQRFGLGDYCGSLFIHALGVAGHDVVKYALDTYGDDSGTLSCTHDANAWPSDQYAGLPAPKDGETVLLWVQNSHPAPIPAGAVGLNLMGSDDVRWHGAAVPGFGTVALDTRALLPEARWPQQIEVQAGKHFVRPRYEILWRNGCDRRRIAHANVERVDLAPDPRLPELSNLMGKGYILPAPVLPTARYRSIALPTPMATTQRELPVALLLYDADGRELGRQRLGRLARADSRAVAAAELMAALGVDLGGGYGHMELVYDFSDGGEADGWLHGLFRYEDLETGHAAETSFGAHVFNTVVTYRREPQSYAGPAPGLSTRLFLRLGVSGQETLCHLIYPASTPWHRRSETVLALADAAGSVVRELPLAIPCGGSRFWRVSDLFDAADVAVAAGGYVLIRDATCRLFGYHGLESDGAFALDHMFGF